MQAVITTYVVVGALPVVIEDEIDEALSYAPGAIFQALSNNLSVVRLLALAQIIEIPVTEAIPGSTVIEGPPGPPGDPTLTGWERNSGQITLVTDNDQVSMGFVSVPLTSKVSIDSASGGFIIGLSIINGTITVTGAGSGSERFGLSSLAAGDSSAAFGNGASSAALRSFAGGFSAVTSGIDSILIGASGNITADETVLLGAGGSVTAAGGLAAGFGTTVSGVDASAWGRGATSNFAGAHAWGAGAVTTAVQQFVFGAVADPISSFHFGKGEVSITGQSVTLSSTRINTSETDVAGSDLTITAGPGTGNATASTISFRTAPAGGSGNAQQVLADQMVIGTGVDITNWLNVGTTTAAVAIGDISASDGTSRFLWDASATQLDVGTEGIITRIRGVDATTAGVDGAALYLISGTGLTTGNGAVTRVAGGDSGNAGIGGLGSLVGGLGVTSGGPVEVIGGAATAAPGGPATFRGGPGAPAGDLTASGGITTGVGGQSGTGTFSGGDASATLISLAGDGIFKGGDGVSNNNHGAHAFVQGGLAFGGGVHGRVQIDTAGVGRWEVDNTGQFLAITDNSFDIGAATSGRPRDLFIARNVIVGGRLTINGTTTTVNSEIQTADNYILLNSEYTADAPQSAGLVMNIDPAATSFSISDITSDVVTVTAGDPSAVLSTGDFVLIQNPANSDNVGIYEVLSTTVSSITIDSTPAEVFTGSGLTDDATTQGVIVGTGLTVIRSSISGIIEAGFSTSSPMTFVTVGGDLDTVLTLGNFTGSNNIVITSGQQISGGHANFGTTTDASADGDLSTGLVSDSRLSYTQSTSSLSNIFTNGETSNTQFVSAVVDLSTSGTATGLIPAGALPVSITTRVLTTLTGGGATGYEIGDTTNADRWGSISALTAGTTSDPTDFTDNTLIFNNSASAADVLISGIGGTPTSGTVRITLSYMSFGAASS